MRRVFIFALLILLLPACRQTDLPPSIEQEMKRTPLLQVTLPNEAEDGLIDRVIG